MRLSNRILLIISLFVLLFFALAFKMISSSTYTTGEYREICLEQFGSSEWRKPRDILFCWNGEKYTKANKDNKQ